MDFGTYVDLAFACLAQNRFDEALRFLGASFVHAPRACGANAEAIGSEAFGREKPWLSRPDTPARNTT